MAKNIVIFSDGTGQEGGTTPNTNIYKMFNMLEDRTAHQIAFYDRGIGTGMGILKNLISAGTGHGFGRNVRDCYEFIFDRYEAGDRLFLIGFSRGAATVRALTYFIHLFGILPHSRPELIPRAWSIYTIRDKERRERQAAEFVSKHHVMWVRVAFLGCYDTVSALGLPWQTVSAAIDLIPFLRHRFYSFTLSESVEHAYQALAIDDERLTFHPVLWSPEVKDYQTVQQVWFAGVHTDVGGGYAEQELSDIPLVWMTRKATQHGLRIFPEHQVRINERIDGIMHDSRAGWWQQFYQRKVRSWPRESHGPPTIHASVLERKAGRDNASPYAPWILEGVSKGDYAVEPWIRHADVPLATEMQRRDARALFAHIRREVREGELAPDPQPG